MNPIPMHNHLKQTLISAFSLLIVGGVLYFGFAPNLPSIASNETGDNGNILQLPETEEKTEETNEINKYSVQSAPYPGGKDLPSSAESVTFFVNEVVDGNTLIGDGDKRIRLIGIKSPDKDEEYGVEATDFLKQLTEGQEIIFIPDKENPRDDFGRLRGVVYRENVNVNIEMLRAGLAHIFPSYPSSINYDDWLDFEKEAKEAKRALWGKERYYNRFVEEEEAIPML